MRRSKKQTIRETYEFTELAQDFYADLRREGSIDKDTHYEDWINSAIEDEDGDEYRELNFDSDEE